MSQLKLQEKSKTVGASLALAQLRSKPISFWLDSSGGPKELCKQSFCGVDPKYYIYGSLNGVNFVDLRTTGDERRTTFPANCFDYLEKKVQEEKSNPNGIFVGYFSYDLFKFMNDKRRTTNDNKIYPDFFFAYFDNVLKLQDPITSILPDFGTSRLQNLLSNMTDSEYLEKVKLIKDEIKKGNVYQVNLTREYSVNAEKVDELDLYLRLREASPNPYGCFFKTPFVTILSSSPEEFLYVGPNISQNELRTTNYERRFIRTRPIKGTIPKGIFDIDPKNQAENIMIVDLERNDLGRICEFGSIKANKLLEVEEYKHLNHVVSTVEGKLKPDIGLRQIFEATFPGGSITGAPKISAMKLIEEIESTKRGAYTGCFGYIKTNGEMNFNILIRTIFVQNLRTTNDKRRITFNIGGGIVADSDPEGELEEIKLKAKGILNALNISI